MSKFDGAMSSTDTCPTTQLFHHLYKDELGIDEGYCWNHIRDVWAGGVHKGISAWAKNELENDLKEIPSIWRVSSDVKEIIVEDLDRVLATLSPRQKRIHIIDNIKIRVEGFGKKQYEHAWTRDGRDVPLEELLSHLKKIIDNEDPTKIPTAPPTNMPQRWKLPKLGQIVVKVEEIDLAAEDDNEELIQM